MYTFKKRHDVKYGNLAKVNYTIPLYEGRSNKFLLYKFKGI